MNPAGNVSEDQLTMSCGQNEIWFLWVLLRMFVILGVSLIWMIEHIWQVCHFTYWLIISKCLFMLVHTYVQLCSWSVNTMLAPHHEVLKHDLIPSHMTHYFHANQELRAFRQQFMAQGWKSWELRGCNSIKLTVFLTSTHFCEQQAVS
jgi:hypothetical protein